MNDIGFEDTSNEVTVNPGKVTISSIHSLVPSRPTQVFR
jgi:hypothetical protein